MSLDSEILQILDSSACLSKGQMTGYLQKNLYPEELRAIELHLSECPFCSDAVDGLELEMQAVALLAGLKQPNLPAPPKESKVEAVLDKVAKTVTLKNNTPKPDAAPKPERNTIVPRKEEVAAKRKDDEPVKVNWLKPLAVAAGLAIAIIGSWYFINGNKDNTGTLSKNEAEDKTPATSADNTSAPVAGAVAPVTDTLSSQKLADATINNKRGSIPAPQAASEIAAKKPTADTHRVAAAKEEMQAEVAEPAAMKRNAAKAAAAEEKEKDDVANRVQETESKKEEPKAKAKQDANMSDYEMALELYKQKQYGSALLYFRTAQRNSSDPKHNDAVYYSAMCYKATGKSRKAKQLFKKLIDDGAPQKSAAQKQLKQLEAED